MRRRLQAAIFIGGLAIIAAVAHCQQPNEPLAPPDPCQGGPDCTDYPDLECPGYGYGCSSGVARYAGCDPDCPTRGSLPGSYGPVGRPAIVAGNLMTDGAVALIEAGVDARWGIDSDVQDVNAIGDEDAAFGGAPDGNSNPADGFADAPK